MQQSSGNSTQSRTPAEDPQAKRTPGAAQKHLEMFLGTWRVTGHNAELAPEGGKQVVDGEESYKPLEGGFFIEGRFERRFAGAKHVGISMLGAEPDGTCFAHNYDNLGYARQYRLTLTDRTWKFDGPNERATIEFSADGKSFHEEWEMSKDGTTWAPLCSLDGKRVME